MKRLLLAIAALVALPAVAGAHEVPSPLALTAAVDQPCGGKAMTPDRVITGSFPAEMQGSYVLLPFTVPDGSTAVRVKYCYDQPDAPTNAEVKHTLDLGLYGVRKGNRGVWGVREFRGWGGSSHPDVTISPEGFASNQGTTRAFRPGPVADGRWAVELGVAAVAGQELGDSDGQVAWRVEIDLIDSAAYADQPYEPARYDSSPAVAKPGWYAGDLHVHAEHSALNDAKMTEVFDYAFGPAGLDFITLSDYVGGGAWGEIGRYQASYPGKLIERSAEVITYRGHANAHGATQVMDYRTGPIYERRADGSLALVRTPQPPSRLLGDIRAAGGVAQLNHVTIFPNEVPVFAFMCRGCPWDYSAEETDYSRVDAIEVATGPAGAKDAPGGLGPNPFTVTAVQFYEDVLATGAHVAAVASSDSHKAGRHDPVTQAPIGQGTTMVYAPELSEAAVNCAVRQGHTYTKMWAADRPDLRLEGRAGDATGIFGDTLVADSVAFTARVLGGAPLDGVPFSLLVLKNGVVMDIRPVLDDDESFTFTSSGPGRYGLRLMRGPSYEAVSTPIWVKAAGGAAPRVESEACPVVTKPKPATKKRARCNQKSKKQRKKCRRRR